MSVIECWLFAVCVGMVVSYALVKAENKSIEITFAVDACVMAFSVSLFTGSTIAGVASGLWGMCFAIALNCLRVPTKYPLFTTVAGTLVIMFASVQFGFLVAG